MAVNVERKRRLYRLPGWVNTLICIAALVGLYYTLQGVNDLVAPAKFNPCGSINPTCAVHPTPKPTGPSTTVPIASPTTVPVLTTQPANCGELPVGPGAGPPPAACSGLP